MTAMGENTVIGIRKFLLDFYSSELHSHSRLILGFCVVFFALWQFFLALVAPSIYSPITFWQYCIVFSGMGFVSTVLWYLIMRYSVYGLLCDSVLTLNLDNIVTLSEALTIVRDHVLDRTRVFDVLPSYLFIAGEAKKTGLQKKFGVTGALILGALICVVLGVITTVLFAILGGLWQV